MIRTQSRQKYDDQRDRGGDVQPDDEGQVGRFGPADVQVARPRRRRPRPAAARCGRGWRPGTARPRPAGRRRRGLEPAQVMDACGHSPTRCGHGPSWPVPVRSSPIRLTASCERPQLRDARATDGREEHARLAQELDDARLPLLRARPADRQRRRLRRADAPAAGARGRSSPNCARPSSPTQRVAGTYSTLFTAGRPPRADAQPRQCVLRRRHRGVGAAGRAGRRHRPGLPVRAQGRRPGHQPGLRGRPAGPRRHPR